MSWYPYVDLAGVRGGRVVDPKALAVVQDGKVQEFARRYMKPGHRWTCLGARATQDLAMAAIKSWKPPATANAGKPTRPGKPPAARKAAAAGSRRQPAKKRTPAARAKKAAPARKRTANSHDAIIRAARKSGEFTAAAIRAMRKGLTAKARSEGR